MLFDEDKDPDNWIKGQQLKMGIAFCVIAVFIIM
jgi:hypothetical protein